MSDTPKLYRKRLIPLECILLENDQLVYQDERILITKWRTIKPKKVLDHGASCYFLKEGWKVSRFLDAESNLICWYCDIIDIDYDPVTNTYTFTDLLADVLIYPDERVVVDDLDEIADALEQGLLTVEQTKACMRRLDSLLQLIYSGELLDLEEVKRLAELR